MKPEEFYQGLKDLADKMGILVSEQKLSTPGLRAKSGLCIIKNRYIMIIDKKLSFNKKNLILSRCLNQMPIDEVYVIPAIREFLSKHKKIFSTPEEKIKIVSENDNLK